MSGHHHHPQQQQQQQQQSQQQQQQQKHANFTAEHRSLQAVCLATAVHGKCALISRRAISVISTSDLSNVEYNIKRETKWDTTFAEFSTLQENLIAITNAQSVQIFNIDDPSSNSLQDTLKAHSRTATDLNWSFSDPNVLATASYDKHVHVWDITDSHKPVLTMSSIAGATQVKWSKVNENILATGHETEVRIWDKRKANTPLHYIMAHLSKINDIDWHPVIGTQFVTCSQDGNIKYWDTQTMSNKMKADNTLATGLPVWRARFTPTGNGLMTALVPQLRRTGENNSLWMWDNHCLEKPLHSFAGHTDVVLDFGWHYKQQQNEFELVTWAKDNALRMWKIDSQMLIQNSPDILDDPLSLQRLDHTSSPAIFNTEMAPLQSDEPSQTDSDSITKLDSSSLSAITANNSVILNLSQEFSLVNQNFPNMTIENFNAQKRMCEVTTAGKSSISCRLRISFPSNYPCNVIPHFGFVVDPTGTNERTLTDQQKKEIIKALQTTATAQVQRNRSCLEKCLRQFAQTFEKLTGSSKETSKEKTHNLLDMLSHKYGSYQDSSVPFPRTSGARFCSSDVLVCFGRPPHLEQMNALALEYTPRSLSTLSAYVTSHVQAYANSEISIAKFYEKRDRFRQRKATLSLCGPVLVISIAKLLPVSRILAEQYLIKVSSKSDVIELCELNGKTALNNGRRDLYQTWTLVKLSAEMYLKSLYSKDPNEMPWSVHPFGRTMIQNFIDHYVLKCNDIQTAAMIACVFTSTNLSTENYYKKQETINNSKIVNYAENTESLVSEFKEKKRTRSCSWSTDPCDSALDTMEIPESAEKNAVEPFENKMIDTILDSSLSQQFDYYKKIYADILYQWKLIENRALILKTVQSKMDDTPFRAPFKAECCKKLCQSLVCGTCQSISLRCIICTLPVKGAANHCLRCGHGGHMKHMREWFEDETHCPSGCGCHCLES